MAGGQGGSPPLCLKREVREGHPHCSGRQALTSEQCPSICVAEEAQAVGTDHLTVLEGRKEGRREGRKEGGKEGRKEGWKEGMGEREEAGIKIR